MYAMLIANAAFAQSAPSLQIRQRAEVRTVDMAMEDVGNAQLIRLPGGIVSALTLDDTDLREGDVYTVWFVVFNDWQQCPSGDCGSDPMDYDDPDLVGLDIGYATGEIVRQDGELKVAAFVPRGMLDGFPDELGQTSGRGLERPLRAEIHVVLRDHGPLEPNLAIDQLTTYMGGCDYGSSPMSPGSAGAAGDYRCADRYSAVFDGQ
jgi:hypothetical protein